ncbi:amidohydrolase [Segetibacter sp. 3557_3]|uniref:amidohydrolase n=1 Tax=Segetibacter sp. 3557_3 TaxID=2547429 RepID=UPI0010591BE3|nr:amidohydrolase [Segetibacter sp. 3557_3]TDH25118.1 amidohydrolase [Segetibacter sp. 3557_3]
MSTLTCTLIQTALEWENKAANMRMLEAKIRGLDKTEVVILPEMFSTGFSMQPGRFAEPMDGPTVEWMRNLSAERKIILTGSLMIEEEGKFYNRLVWMLPNGQMGFYDKRHLFAYANEHNHYTRGEKRLVASVKGWKINLQVCYDLRFPVWARQQTDGEPEYDLLVYVANWPERRSHAWKTLLKARAIENQCFVIGVNRVGDDGNGIYHSGDSMIINPIGEVQFEQAHNEFEHTVTLQKDELNEVRLKMPFWKDADPFMILQ